MFTPKEIAESLYRQICECRSPWMEIDVPALMLLFTPRATLCEDPIVRATMAAMGMRVDSLLGECLGWLKVRGVVPVSIKDDRLTLRGTWLRSADIKITATDLLAKELEKFG